MPVVSCIQQTLVLFWKLMMAADVSANLKNKVPKAAAQKVLQALAGKLVKLCEHAFRLSANNSDRGDLTLKPYGKQSIFVYNQVSGGASYTEFSFLPPFPSYCLFPLPPDLVFDTEGELILIIIGQASSHVPRRNGQSRRRA